MPKKEEKESIHFECDDPEVLKKIREATEKEGSLKAGVMSLLKESQKENIEKGIESTTETVIEEETLEEDKFPCDKLCKKFRSCNSNAIFIKGEIKEQHCYLSKYPYDWTTPEGKYVQLCKFMVFESTQPKGDPEHPYPMCIAKQKDIPIQIPKDRIMRDPQICWSCYMMRKKAREEQFIKKHITPLRPAKVNWGNSEGVDAFSLGDR